MLKKLRIKFVALIMSVVALVLVVVFTAICVINYQQSLQATYAALDSAITRTSDGGRDKIMPFVSGRDDATTVRSDAQGALAGDVPDGGVSSEGIAADPSLSAEQGSATSDQGGEDTSASKVPLEIGGRHAGAEQIIPVAVYALNTDGSLVVLSDFTQATLSDEVLRQATEKLADQPDGTGELESLGLYYEKRTMDSSTFIAFADMSATSGWQGLALTLLGVFLVALVVFFVIGVFFSRWALRPVEAAWDRQRRFVSDASHELKTPLTVILANTAILQRHPERSIESQSQWVESTQTETERLQELVDDLLFLARLDDDTHSTEDLFGEVDLSDLIEGDLLQFESVAFERKVAIESHLDDHVMVRGSNPRLHRLTSTLLDNACKYAETNTTVTVSLHRFSHKVLLSFHNRGSVISPDDLPYVFDRFYRADKARNRDAGGYGLGLAIAREVAEEHGGSIRVVSTEDMGTTFTVELPLL